MSETNTKTKIVPTTCSTPSTSRFEGIDVLRGFAALTVVFSHYSRFWDRYLGDIWLILPDAIGYYAVNLFFVISGMVIFMTLKKCNSVFDFALLRFSRLYPAYWTTLAMATLVGVKFFQDSLWLGGFVVNLTMFQEFVGFANLDNVYWSLTVELAFYLNVAWLFALGLHKKVYACIAVWLCCSGMWALSVVDPSADDRDWISIFFALDYAPFFAIGILFYNGHGRHWKPVEFVLLFAALIVEFMIAGWEGLTVATISTMLVWAAMTGYLRFVTCGLTSWLGSISYSLYLVHRNIGYDLLPWLHEHGFDAVPGIAITTIIVISLAAAVTFFVEKPTSRAIRSLWRNMKLFSTGHHSKSGS